MFDDLPAGSVLVRAAVVATLSGPPAALAAPETVPDAPAEAPAPAPPEPLSVRGTTYTETEVVSIGWGLGADAKSAAAAAEADALALIFQAAGGVFRHAPISTPLLEQGGSGPPPDPAVLAALDLKHTSRPVGQRVLASGQILAAVRVEAPRSRFGELAARCERMAPITGAIVGECIEGRPSIVIVDQLRMDGPEIGDVVVAFGSKRVSHVEQIREIQTGTAAPPDTVKLLRDGKTFEVSLQQVPPPDRFPDRDLAPTCGPCCHGDCGDRKGGWPY